MMTAKQAAERKKGIGSSDVPTILGINPWANSHDLWLQKTGRVPPTEENDAMYMGTMLEEVVLKLAADRLEQRIVKPSTTFVGAKSFMRANIDGMIGKAMRGATIVEAKTTGNTEDWGLDGSSDVPERIKAQVQYQMMCASSDVAHVACLIGERGLRFAMFRIPYDEFYAEHIMEQVSRFWEHNVKTDTPPECLPSLESVRRIIRSADAPIVAIEERLFEEDAAANAMLKDAKSKHEAARSALLCALGQSTHGEGGGFKVRVSVVESDRFDAKRFVLEHPEYADAFRILSSHSRVTITAAKKGVS